MIVDIGRIDGARLPFFVEVLEQLLARQLLAGPDDARDAAITDLQPPRLAGLALELEPQCDSLDSDVAAEQRRQAIAAVLPRIVVVADADERRVEKVDHRRQNLVARQSGAAPIGFDLAAKRRQAFRKRQDEFVLGSVAQAAEVRMVAVLLAPGRVAPSRLQVAGRVRAYPDVRPGRRDGQ